MAITKYAFRRPAFSPWFDEDVTNRLARMFDDSYFTPQGAATWMPPVSVSETNDELLLTAELPGMKEDDIHVELENNVLTISGEKIETHEEKDEERKYHVYERNFGSFSRSFTLPRTVDGTKIVANFDHGVLTVKLPKAPDAKGRRIAITK